MHRHFFHDHHHHRGRGPFGGHMRGGPGGRHRGGRIGRLLEHGDLKFIVLALIAEQPRHGYELMKELEDRTGGSYRPSPGVIYPTLALLEDEGFVRQASPEAGRKLFEITDAGREALTQNQAGVDAVFARMDEAAAQSDASLPRVRRAMGNLALALKFRLGRGPLNETEVEAVAKIIDDAAAAIERA